MRFSKKQITEQQNISRKAQIRKKENRKEALKKKFEADAKDYNNELNNRVAKCLHLLSDNEIDNKQWIELFDAQWKAFTSKVNRLNNAVRLPHNSFMILITRYININKIISIEPSIPPMDLTKLSDEEILKLSNDKKAIKQFAALYIHQTATDNKDATKEV